MERFENFLGKRDRRLLEESDFKVSQGLGEIFSIEATSDTHKNAVQYFKLLVDHIKIHGNEIDPESAINFYLNFRSCRHDSWVEFLNKHKVNIKGDFGDIKVYNFLKENNFLTIDDVDFLDREALNKEQIIALNNEKADYCKRQKLLDYYLMCKSPDILSLSEGTIYIGDVTVTKDEGNVKIWKHDKYKPIADWLSSNGYCVVHKDFIVREDLSNVSTYIKSFTECGMIMSDDDSRQVYEHFHQSMTESMRLTIDFCTDKSMLHTLINVNDKSVPPLEQLKLNYPHSPFEEYKPNLSEHEVIAMIKKRVDGLDSDNFFDIGVDTTLKAFDKIIEDNKAALNFAAPKSTLKVIDNTYYYEPKSGNDLIMDFTLDVQNCDHTDPISDYLQYLLPTPKQVTLMNKIYTEKISQKDVKKNEQFKKCKVNGNGYFGILSTADNHIISNYKSKLSKGKSMPNEKKAPEQISPCYYESATHFISKSMEYYGSLSNKKPFLDDSWDAKSGLEEQESRSTRSIYDYVRRTNGAQLCHSMAQLYNKIIHTSTYQGSNNIVYVPPNGSFICIIPNSHGPVNRASCDLPFIFITRSTKGEKLKHIEFEYSICSDTHRYYVSKLCRLNINKIAGWNNAGYQLVSCATYMLSTAPKLQLSKEKYIGMLTYMSLDCHQKTSEYLDLLKYVSFMPFSEIHLLPKLVADKFNLLMKTQLDVWMLMHMRDFVKELAKMDKLEPSKPKVQIINNRLITDCLGLDIKLPTFVNPLIRHDQCVQYIEEISMVYTIRPKHLYGSQFMDKAMSSICKWNDDYQKSVEVHGDWVVGGEGVGDFPFECDFAYCASAIYYASVNAARDNPLTERIVHNEVLRSDIFEFMHYNCTLRGCTKEKGDRKSNIDLHSTSIDECLKYYAKKQYNDLDCTVISCAQETLRNKNHVMQFTKSEKEQRGGGRPIATPTLRDKMMLMCVEKPELAKGTRTKNNIIVPKKNKLKEQADNYKEAIVNGTIRKYKYCAQITEDQTKFSEMDNTRKFKIYVRSDKNAPREVRQLQLDILEKLENREHLIKRIPKEILEKHEKWINEDRNGIRAIIGWPQGMLNFISTSIHSDADMWIVRAYNMAYPNNTVYTRGLVHSDDSSVIVCFNDIRDYKRFCLFRMEAKRMFCLKLNIKKLWGSIFFGEIVSNYNVNGNVHMSVAKTIANSFTNLTFHNWPTDVSNQMSTIQQCFRNGCGIPGIILMTTVLKQQMTSTYQVKGLQAQYLHDLPIDLGGYPDNSAFEIGVTGVTCHYRSLIEKYNNVAYSKISSIVRFCLKKSKEIMTRDPLKAKKMVITEDWADLIAEDHNIRKLTSDDFENISMPSKGDIFLSIKHLMPKSTKIKQTVDRIKSLPFEPSGLEMLITRPKSLSEALGNLKSQTSNMFYQLASESYTQSSKRMAMSQTIQSSGKVVVLDGYNPMTYNDLLETLFSLSTNCFIDATLIRTAFSDDNELVDLCSKAVNNSESYMTYPDKRKVLNRMPTVEDKFKTIAPLKDVLLYIIETDYRRPEVRNEFKEGTKVHKMISNLYTEYGTMKANLSTVSNDAAIIRKRFEEYFSFYQVISACSLIMRQYLSSVQSRLWVQPSLKHESLQGFVETLYGKTISYERNYNITIVLGAKQYESSHKNWVRTLYTTEVLNKIYDGKFNITSVNIKPKPVSVSKVLSMIDYKSLDDDYMLKYAILVLLVDGREDTIRSVISNKKYSQFWERAQSRGTRGYSGKFVVIVKYSGVVVKFEGEPGDVKITSSSDNISKILMAMKIFVEKNFKSYGYTNPGEWGRSDFWRSRMPSSNYLVCYSSVNTQIRPNVPDDSRRVSFFKDVNLTYRYPDAVELSGKIVLDKTLRVVSIKEGMNTYRVDSVYQDLGLPFSDYISLTPSWLDGIPVTKLYKTHIILDLTLDRYFNVSKKDVEECLKSSPTYDATPILKSYYNCVLTMMEQEQLPDNEEVPPEVVETFDLKGMTIEVYEEIGRTTKVEELNPDAICYDYTVEASRKGAIYIHKDIMRLLAKMHMGMVSDLEKYDLIKMICTDRYIIGTIKEIVSIAREDPPGISELFNELIESNPAENFSYELYCFIMATKLDLGITWKKMNLKQIIESPTYFDYNKASYYGELYIDLIAKHNCEEREEEVSILDIVKKI